MYKVIGTETSGGTWGTPAFKWPAEEGKGVGGAETRGGTAGTSCLGQGGASWLLTGSGGDSWKVSGNQEGGMLPTDT